ncbi:bifunctional 2-C-methyl-D-erythritol 4-phosphate cytidylyltransferase/2-C-methyl-D-erythritol 2,4-cyclodiphosphate synthase [Salinarimonas rosea]|uniref:bifunctional 2-C-methyl-D-erythritol 4-phosphate cytidylyltransferase/2-C-methyl-D-erythritol 2,4-cyclodiphosphate synthase n=1 Tax=Salinarimonas rosea TaxID=552063 RepID=UPI000419A43E|nr:bifunctional 2-C-methyl-D-erythritol 4-phosphate cytidylyltransferase/2-C-methyl-D-erythritol 2,4-cyclodiphosphate synthase [Salinarimonas rosea]
MSAEPRIAALIVAAGRGARAGTGDPKQYRLVGGASVLGRVLAVFGTHAAIDRILVVTHPDDGDFYARVVAVLDPPAREKLASPVPGGATRQASVARGLVRLAELGAAGIVLVHDAARPFLSPALIDRAIAATQETGAAIPGVAVVDTVKRVDETGRVVETPPRASLRAVQTPQGFRFASLLEAHRAAADAGREDFTDDGALMEWAGHPVTVFEGEAGNIKLTRPEDFAAAGGEEARMITRLGTGFDVHAFTEGDHVWLGGVRIHHERGVLAHSDGDVVLHALTDALLGALAEGDIGTHFPPSDPKWKSASSDRFLAFAAERVRARGGVIDLLDATILAEAPKVGPHREAMREAIARAADVPVARVSIKATTTERLGFTGRREGIAAQAAATIRLPEEHA